ncbi:MAG: hypothetical protein JSS66_02410 [Armatimonadetes bacterium]|nr:hypothetical protein [Armatimonadota bacterium]
MVATVVATGPVESWPKYSSADRRFDVKLPAEPTRTSEEVETDSGVLVRNTLSCSAGPALYQVSFVDLPERTLTFRNSEQVLDAASDLGESVKPGQVFSEGIGRKEGRPWRRFRIVVPNGPVVSHFLLVDGKRLYHLAVVAPPSNWRKVKAKDFFDSFTMATPEDRPWYKVGR